MKQKYNTTSFDATAADLCPRKEKRQTQIIKDVHQNIVKTSLTHQKNTIMKDPPAENNFSLLNHQKINFNNPIKNLQL
ncbi:hypothetical protein FF18_08925 [Elizabethkingia anophelis]|uniref:hypothetical protein n=1 Tax=Elizabethkingia anophelis TaxID=1117645 RepID=UPI0004E36744|nr:hypothetical protein [Elizabethkingia anophelis]KFC33512.1 hypothetical protein FF18_08925 [Elizabethkingia anophelis]